MSAFDDLLASIDVPDWLDTQGIDYRKGSGTHLNVKECPFCGDSRWKVYMRAADGLGTCFHGDCQKGFNLWSFAREHLGADNRATAVHFEDYARATGITAGMPRAAPPSPEDAPGAEGWHLPPSTPLPLPSGHTHPFLIDRRITLATQALFGLRFCDEGCFEFPDAEDRTRRTDFGQRIIIPVHDLDGTLSTFQGRDVTGDSDRRYLFPTGLPGTGRFLYGGHLVRGREHLVMCEGPFDVMATHQAMEGLPEFRTTGVIGSFGLSIGHSDETGDDQLGRLRQLRREGTRSLTFLWDGERGALKQALLAGKLLRDEGFKVRVGLLPAGCDPNEVDTAVVRAAITNAMPLTDEAIFRLSFRSPYR